MSQGGTGFWLRANRGCGIGRLVRTGHRTGRLVSYAGGWSGCVVNVVGVLTGSGSKPGWRLRQSRRFSTSQEWAGWTVAIGPPTPEG